MYRLLPFALALAACAPETAATDATAADWTITEAPPPAPATLTLSAPASAPIGGSIDPTVSGLQPGEQVALVRGTGVGDGPCPTALGGQCVELTGFRAVDGTTLADRGGNARFQVRIPANAPDGAEAVWIAVARRGPGFTDTVVSNLERVRATDGSTRLRVVHASPDAPAVDIYANGGLLLPNVPYLAGTGYLSVPAGDYTVDIRAAGADPTTPPVFSADLSLAGGASYTAVAAGFLGSSNPADAFRVLALGDDWGSPANGTYRARVIHASPDAPTVDLDVGNDGSSEVGALPRFGETGIAGVPLPAQSLQVGVAGGALAFTLPAFTTGEEITVIATGRLGARPNEADAFGLLALDENGVIGFVRQNPIVYALHASPGAPPVDVQAGGATLIEDLPFRALAGPLQVPPGDYTLDIFDSTGAVFVASQTFSGLAAGESYLLIATGLVGGNPPFQILATTDSAAIDPSATAVQAIHASPDAPAVDVGVVANGSLVPVWGAVPFGAIGSAAFVPPATYSFGIGLPGGPLLFEFPALAVEGGQRLVGVATGLVGDGSFGLTVIDQTASPWAAFTVNPL